MVVEISLTKKCYGITEGRTEGRTEPRTDINQYTPTFSKREYKNPWPEIELPTFWLRGQLFIH